MNLPNKLSLSRIVAVPFLLVLLLGSELAGGGAYLLDAILQLFALLLIIAVSITDWLDGKIARERGLITNLGKLMDPLADKIVVTSALVALVQLGLVPGWAVILIIGREFLVTGLRSVAAEAGRVISADRLGKHKTGWQLGLIITAILVSSTLNFRRAASEEAIALSAGDLAFYGAVLIWIPLAVTLYLTAISGWNYVRDNLDLLSEEHR